MFDILVQWQDGSTNICSLFDFWFTKTVKVGISSKIGKITKVLSSQKVRVLWTDGSKGIYKPSELSWQNRDDFMNLKLQWAGDLQWEGTIIQINESREKFNPILHNRQAVQNKECTDECETESCSSCSSEDSFDCSSEDEHPLKTLSENQINKENHNFWSSQGDKLSEYPFQGERFLSSDVRDPIDYFEEYFDEEFVRTICENSNLYARFKDINSTFNLSQADFKIYMGVLFYMSLLGMNNTRRYWATYSRVNLVADQMSLSVFEKIRSYIHFVPPQTMTSTSDKFTKFRPILDQFNKVCSKIDKEEKCSVDENTIPYKGKKSKLRQYNPKKPKKWGLKLFMICTGEFGIIIGTQLYGGKGSITGKEGLLKSSQVVYDLARVLPDDKNFKIAYDNWFSSPLLFEKLQQRGIQSVATIQLSRFRGLKFPDDRTLKQENRGKFIEYQGHSGATRIIAVKWYDNRPVHLASTYIGAKPATLVKRWCFNENKEIQIDCPALVPEYNSFMGQIDNIGRLMSLYRIKMETRKRFYLKIFYHFADLAVINSWLLYRRDFNDMMGLTAPLDLWAFKARVASSLCAIGHAAQTKSPGRPRLSAVDHDHLTKRKRGPTKPIPEKQIRMDNYNHWPIYAEKRGRCKFPNCTGSVYTKCEKCDTYLCLTSGKNCFKDFHTK